MRHNGISWLPGPSIGATGSNPYIQTLTGVTSFSPFAVRTEPIPRPGTGIYPNPATTILNVVLDLPTAGDVCFSIYDATGRLVSQQTNRLNNGLSQTTIDVKRLSSGVYALKVSTYEDEQFLVQKFVKSN